MKMTREQRLKLTWQMFEEGASREEIAEACDVSPYTVKNDLQFLGLTREKIRLETKKEQIISLYEQGYSFTEIADTVGFSDSAISTKLYEWGYHQRGNIHTQGLINENTLWAKSRKKAVPCVVEGKKYLDVTEIFCPS